MTGDTEAQEVSFVCGTALGVGDEVMKVKPDPMTTARGRAAPTLALENFSLLGSCGTAVERVEADTLVLDRWESCIQVVMTGCFDQFAVLLSLVLLVQRIFARAGDLAVATLVRRKARQTTHGIFQHIFQFGILTRAGLVSIFDNGYRNEAHLCGDFSSRGYQRNFPSLLGLQVFVHILANFFQTLFIHGLVGNV